MNFASVSMPFGKKDKDSQSASQQPKGTASTSEFDSYLMTADNSPHPKPTEKGNEPSSSFASGISKFTLPLGVGKSAEPKPKPPEIKTSSQQEYEQYEATAENSPYKPPPVTVTSKFSATIGSTLSKLTQKASNPKPDLHVDAGASNTKTQSEEEYEQFAMTAENSPDKKVQPKPKATVASRMKSITDFTSNIGKNISDILDLPEPTTNNNTKSNSNGNSKDAKPAEADIFSSSVLDVVKSLGNDLKQGAKQMMPTKSSAAATAPPSSAAAALPASSSSLKPSSSSSTAAASEVRSSSAGRRAKPPPPKENTRIFDYLEMSKDDEETDKPDPHYQPSTLRNATATTVAAPPAKPARDNKSTSLFTPVKGSSTASAAASDAAVTAGSPLSSSSSTSTTTPSAASSSGLNTTTASSAEKDSSFDYLAHNISLNTDLTPIRSPLINNNNSNNNPHIEGSEDRMEALLRSIYEAEQQQLPLHADEEGIVDVSSDLRASSSEDVLENEEKTTSRVLDKEDAAEYDDDYCV